MAKIVVIGCVSSQSLYLEDITNLWRKCWCDWLSCALRIQEAGHSVTIIAKDFPSGFETIDSATQINFTSPWGGAHNRFILPPPGAAPDSQEAREHAMSLITWEEMRSLHARHPEAGITFMKAYDYFEVPELAQTSLTEERARNEYGMKGFRFHTKDELPNGVQMGMSMTPVKREIREPLEVFEMKEVAPFDALINASGIGFGDPDVFIITVGQTCLVANPCPVTIVKLNAVDMPTFNVPRNFEGGTIIGGTKIPNDWNPNPSLELREKILSNFAAIYPDILGPEGKFTVIKDIIGRRPARKGGMRLEKEIAQGEKCIIHAYGLGGRGYELSWGVADKVGKLLASHLGSADIPVKQMQAKI
ncbi:hypothetical protein RRF57_012651 [Xylaria bambusicola]|uniref:FAD dependent oxidoreductase domain-containing protein n=1 Tax=Xylaria bambusicola TaxID=326684 RepID=A0AAN7UYB4_9PEZI